MTRLIEILNGPLAEKVGWTLLHFAWQGMLVALDMAILLRIMQRSSAQHCYLVSGFGLVVLVACPLVTVVMLPDSADVAPGVVVVPVAFHVDAAVRGIPSPAGTEEWTGHNVAESAPDSENSGPGPAAAPETHATPQPAGGVLPSSRQTWTGRLIELIRSTLQPWLPSLVSCWFAGVIICSIRLLVAWRCVQRFRTDGTTLASEPLVALQRRLIERVGVRRVVRLLESTLVEVPMVIGWFRPVILLPVAATTGLSSAQLEAIIAHELAHIRCWDYPVNLLQSVIETLLFYHPAVWWVSSRMRQERENCCDDIASEVCGDRVGCRL